MKTKGHWPRGRRRHAAVRVRGYPTMQSLLSAARAECRSRYGAQAELCRSLRVCHKTVQVWLAGRKWPSQRRANRIAAWLRRPAAPARRAR